MSPIESLWRLSACLMVGCLCRQTVGLSRADGPDHETVSASWAAPTSEEAGAAPDQILIFADQLFQAQDYYRSITEYERFACLYPEDVRVAEVRFRVAQSYLQGHKYEAAMQQLSRLTTNETNVAIADKAKRLLADAYYWSGQYSLAATRYNVYLQENPNEPNDSPMRLNLSLACLRSGNLAWARMAVRGDGQSSSLDHERDVDQFEDLPRKSPMVAGLLSSVLPGAGQLYDGNVADAANAFTLNGLTIAGAVMAFDQDEPVMGTLLSALALVWYSGNIYNAINGAHRQNKQLRDAYLMDLEIKWGMILDRSGNLAPSVGASGQF